MIDGLAFAVELADLLSELRELYCDLITTRSSVVEFLGGTKNEELYEKKQIFLEKLFGKPLDKIVSLPIDSSLPTRKDFLVFSRQCNKFGYVDFELYLTLKRYRTSNIFLATRNHSDFTAELFKRHGFMTLLGKKEIRTYGLYSVKQ